MTDMTMVEAGGLAAGWAPAPAGRGRRLPDPDRTSPLGGRGRRRPPRGPGFVGPTGRRPARSRRVLAGEPGRRPGPAAGRGDPAGTAAGPGPPGAQAGRRRRDRRGADLRGGPVGAVPRPADPVRGGSHVVRDLVLVRPAMAQ